MVANYITLFKKSGLFWINSITSKTSRRNLWNIVKMGNAKEKRLYQNSKICIREQKSINIFKKENCQKTLQNKKSNDIIWEMILQKKEEKIW